MKFTPREKTPTILQMDNAECGAVALAIILAYFGRYVSASAVREACDVSRDGSKAINIIKVARQYGLDAHGLQLNLDKVKQLPPPFIVYWQFNHFLVVEGFAENSVYINDPATGPRIVTMHEFAQSFTGIVLFMSPGPDFRPEGQPELSILKLLWQRLSGSRMNFVYIILMTIGLGIPVIGLAFFTKIFLDNILLAQQRAWFPGLLFCMAAAAVMMAGLTWFKNYALIRLYMKLKLTNITQVFWRLLHLPMKFFQQRAAGDIVERVEAHSYLADVLANKATNSIARGLTMLLIAVMMFLLSWPLALISMVIVIIHCLLYWRVSRRNDELGRRFAQTEGKLSSIEVNGMQIIETLKANAVEDQFFNQWAAAHAQKVANEQQMKGNSRILKILSILSQGLNLVVLLALGCWFIMHNQITPGGLMAIEVLLISFNWLAGTVLEAGEYPYKFKGHITRISDIMDQATDNILNDSVSKNLVLNNPHHPILEFRNIEFGYSKLESPILMNVSFQVQPGERIAIIGPTGGGKSSVAKLICGLFAPWAGEILVQGLPLAEISRSDFAKFMGLVDQQIFLFAATVRDNLTLWNPEISDAEIYQALKIASVDEVIRERGGLNYHIAERGKNFSGGQVQRLEIARALIGNPRLLVLDEATSALDPLVEQQIYANLRQHGCTLVIIAHRLSAIRDCDQIIVINEGKIVQRGRHASLIQGGGLYKELVSLEIQ